MPTHDVLNERLSEYLDNELDDAGRAEVAAHLAECGECRADLQALAAVVAVLVACGQAASQAAPAATTSGSG